MGTVLKHLLTGNLVRYLFSIPTVGQGAVHVLEDLASGLVRIEKVLDGYQVHDDQTVTSPWEEASESPQEAALEAEGAAPAPAPAPAPAAPAGSAGAGLPPGLPPEVQGPQSAPGEAPAAGSHPDLPPTAAA